MLELCLWKALLASPYQDLSELDVRQYSGVLLDGVADALTLKKNRESLQGRPKICRGGRSATMMYSYPFTLCRRGVVVTMDLSAKNLELFRTDHWLSNPMNCLVLRLSEPAYTVPVASTPGAAPQETPQERVATWTASDLRAQLEALDMSGPAAHLFSQSVDGSDFLTLTEKTLIDDVRCTPFVAKKLLKARTQLLQ